MATINFKDKFIVTFNEETLTGFRKILTKKQLKDNEDKYKDYRLLLKKYRTLRTKRDSLIKRMDIKEKMQDFVEMDKIFLCLNPVEKELIELAEQIDNHDAPTEMNVAELDMTIESDEKGKARLKELAEMYGYDVVFDAINRGVEEGKSKGA